MNIKKFITYTLLFLCVLCFACRCSAGLVYDAYMSHSKKLVLFETTKPDQVTRTSKTYLYTEIYRNKNLKTRFRLEIREEKGNENSEELIVHVLNYNAKNPFYNTIVFTNSQDDSDPYIINDVIVTRRIIPSKQEEHYYIGDYLYSRKRTMSSYEEHLEAHVALTPENLEKMLAADIVAITVNDEDPIIVDTNSVNKYSLGYKEALNYLLDYELHKVERRAKRDQIIYDYIHRKDK